VSSAIESAPGSRRHSSSPWPTLGRPGRSTVAAPVATSSHIVAAPSATSSSLRSAPPSATSSCRVPPRRGARAARPWRPLPANQEFRAEGRGDEGGVARARTRGGAGPAQQSPRRASVSQRSGDLLIHRAGESRQRRPDLRSHGSNRARRGRTPHNCFSTSKPQKRTRSRPPPQLLQLVGTACSSSSFVHGGGVEGGREREWGRVGPQLGSGVVGLR
jgi:hypothetical protein